MTKPVSLFEIVDHKYCKICRRSTMGKNIEKRNILFKNRMCSPIIEARSTKRGCESIVKYCFFIVLVLIDTWWNVNSLASGSGSLTGTVLIDTWWNVNSVGYINGALR